MEIINPDMMNLQPLCCCGSGNGSGCGAVGGGCGTQGQDYGACPGACPNEYTHCGVRNPWTEGR